MTAPPHQRFIELHAESIVYLQFRDPRLELKHHGESHPTTLHARARIPAMVIGLVVHASAGRVWLFGWTTLGESQRVVGEPGKELGGRGPRSGPQPPQVNPGRASAGLLLMARRGSN
jgi:hypothetical protein